MLDLFYENEISDITAMRQIWTTKKYSFLKKPRANFGLLFLKKGKMSYNWEDGGLELKINDVVFLPKNSYYEAIFETEDEAVECLLINFNLINSSCGIKVPQKLLHDESKLILNSFEAVLQSFKNQEDEFIKKSKFYLLLHNINTLTEKNTENKEYAIMKKAAEMLEIFDEMSVSDIAAKTLMCQSSFQKKFKKHFSCTPSEYRIMRKIQKAKEMLVYTDIPIKEIVLRLNFYDVSYFYKMFYKNCNTTPIKYRENNRGGI